MYSKGHKGASSRLKKRSQKKQAILKLINFFVPILFLISLIFLLRSDFLQVKEIKVINTVTQNSEEIREMAESLIKGDYFFVVPKSSLIFLDEKKISSAILSNFSRLKEVDVSKKSDGSLEIRVEERRASFLWCDNLNNCFLMQDDGLIFSEAKPKEKSAKLIFRGGIVGNPLMRNLSSPEIIDNYLIATETLEKSGFKTTSIIIELQNKTIFQTSAGQIFFNPEEDLVRQATNAILLILELRKQNPEMVFEYVDARFGNKVFYRLPD